MIVELAQNAADAAARAGVPGRIRFTLRGRTLDAANTGAPLDAPGVESLSTLRASAKRDDPRAVGRFGVGFAAVVAVSDEPSIASRGLGGVAWSAERTREAVAAIPGLAAELKERDGQVPLLRLPFTAPETPTPEGFDTVVRLPLRNAEAEALVARLLAEAGAALMLALPALAEVVVDIDGDVRRLTAAWEDGVALIDGTRWRTVEAGGRIEESLLRDRPVEERPHWQVRWAMPEGPLTGVPPVVHAPTPSDEPLGLPALLIASFPLAPDRRHVAPGPLTDFLVERAAEAYVRLLPPEPRLLDLVPGPVAEGELDARIRRAVLERLPDAPLFPGGTGRDAVVVDGPAALPEVLAEVLPGLLPAAWPARHPALDALGVRRMSLADVADALAELGGLDAGWWRRLYGALDGADRDALAGLPVPLADGRLVRGPRGLLITDPTGLDPLGLRIVAPEAAHPLLARLGAVEAGPRQVLDAPQTGAAVAASQEEEDPEPIWHAVLTLAERCGLRPGERPWLAELALPDTGGDLYPAGELLLPDAPLREVVAADAPFGVVDAGLVERYGAEVLEAVGVLRTFALVRAEDVFEPAFGLDGEEEWAGQFGDGFTVPEFTAVRDLELVADWPGALALLARSPLRDALIEPVRVLLADGRGVSAPSYTAWWLRRHPVIAGRRPGELSTGAELTGLYDPAPADLDPALARALGVRTGVAALLAEPDGPTELLDRLADPGREISADRLRGLWRALAADLDDRPDPPERVRAFVDGEPEVVPAEDAIVVDRPDMLPLLFVPVEVADALELSLASEEMPGVIESTGVERPVPDALRAVLPGSPSGYVRHDRLVVDGQEVTWWYDDGAVHASGPAGLARGAAWAAGRWRDRYLAEAALRAPGDLPTLLAEAALEDP